MGYRIDGTYLENCNCDIACPCGASNLLLPATNERCTFLMAFRIGSGDVDGVDVSGATLALVGDAPGQMSDGNWRVGLVFDADTSEEQREALIGVFSGQMGGPPGIVAPLIGEMLGVDVAPIRYEEDGRRHSVVIGDMVDIEVEDFAGAAEGEVMELHHSMHPAGPTLALAQATRSRMSVFGIDMSAVGKNGHSSTFTWAA
jgi:hypothetical protein